MARWIAHPRSEVPYLTERQIEEEANVLLAEYGLHHGEVATPPIPIDEILEIHLELALEFKDMGQLFGHGDVHGAIWINEALVGVDVSLDPSVHPTKLGRCHYTLAHETGHWQLHRKFYLQNQDQQSLFDKQQAKPAYICRSTERKKPVEWQADFFGACLLMPRKMVKVAWEAWRGKLDSVLLDDLRSQANTTAREDMDNKLMDSFARPLAEQFKVSSEAMRIRLEELGLLLRKKEASLFD